MSGVACEDCERSVSAINLLQNEVECLKDKVSRLEKEVEEYREERDDAQFALEEAEADVARLRKQVKMLESDARVKAITDMYEKRMNEKRDKALDALRTGLMELMPLTFGIVPPDVPASALPPSMKCEYCRKECEDANHEDEEGAWVCKKCYDDEVEAKAQSIAEEAEEAEEEAIRERKEMYLATYEPEWPDDRESTALWRARQG